jgi:hypothetical protein
MHAGSNRGRHVTTVSRIISRLIAAVLLGAVPLATAEAAQVTIQANANVVKALTFTSKQELDFGTVMPAATGTTTVSMSMAGAITCPAAATCTGASRPAIFNVQGTNKGVVQLIVAPSNLVNSATGGTIRFTPAAPATITLTNSGQPGNDFNVGGSIAIPSTAAGAYIGNIEVTADYQ